VPRAGNVGDALLFEILRPQYGLVALGQAGQGTGDCLGLVALLGLGVSGGERGVEGLRPRLLCGATAIAQQVGGDAAQPGEEGRLRRIEGAHTAHRDEPGFLHHLLRQVAQTAAAPGHVGVQACEGGVVEGLPGALIAGQHGRAQGMFLQGRLARRHGSALGLVATRPCHQLIVALAGIPSQEKRERGSALTRPARLRKVGSAGAHFVAAAIRPAT
jgi:hypothetical protein